MPDREKVIKEYEDYVNSYISLTTSHDYEFEMHKAVLALLKEQEHKDRMYHALEDDWKRLKELLKEQEAVDKNTGEWKNGHCSCCGEDVSSMLDTWTNVQKFLFCPNCGARMKER